MYREALKIARLFGGLFLYAFGNVLTMHANMGFSPWNVFHQGLALHLGITIGNASILVAFIIVTAIVLLKEKFGLATLCNMCSIGLFMDLLMKENLIPIMQGFFPGLAMMLSGLTLIALASFFYIGAGYGAGPRDSLMVALVKRTGKEVGFCRGTVEGSALFFGWLLGGYVGIGTLIPAFGVSFAVQVVFTLLHFDVKKIHQESFRETCLRFEAFLLGRRMS